MNLLIIVSNYTDSLLFPTILLVVKILVLGDQMQLATNDKWIKKLTKDQNYKFDLFGNVHTRVAPTGKVYVDGHWRKLIPYKGYMTYNRKKLHVGRIFFYLVRGALDPKKKVVHLDGNSNNINASNLAQLSQHEINLLRFQKHPPVMGNKKLNWGTVSEIRRMKRLGFSHSSICLTFNISKGHVSEIVNNKIWIEGKNYYGHLQEIPSTI